MPKARGVRRMAKLGEAVDNFTPDVGWERWRGAVDQKLETIEKGQGELKQGMIDMTTTITGVVRENRAAEDTVHRDLDTRLRALETHTNITKAKIAVFAGIAGILGGGLSSAAWGVAFRTIWP